MRNSIQKDPNKYTIIHRGVILQELSTLDSNELTTGSVLNVLISGGREYSSDSSSSSIDSDIPNENIISEHDLPDLAKIPLLTRLEYSTIPKLPLLARMTENQLANVENFTIQNNHGKVIFDGFTDVRQLDLDQIVFIEKQSVNKYIYTAIDRNI